MTVLVAKVKCKLNFYVKIYKEKKEFKMIGPILYQILYTLLNDGYCVVYV